MNATGRKHAEMAADHEVWLAAQPMTARCAFCEWSFTGTAAEGLAASAAHRKAEHPQAKRGKRPKMTSIPMAPVKDPVTQAEGVARGAEVAAMHARRALVEAAAPGPRPARVPIVEDPAEPWHGTITGYFSKGCRGEKCRAAAAEYHRVRRARRVGKAA